MRFVRRSLLSVVALILLLAAAGVTIAQGQLPAGQDSSPRSKPARRKREAKPAPRTGRETIELNGVWRTRADVENAGTKAGWTSASPTDAASVTVPSLRRYSGARREAAIAWYWREFDAPARWKGQTVRLHFGSVAGHADVWLNGQRLGEHSDDVLPFDLNATAALKVGESNLLGVRLEGAPGSDIGLWQGVALLSHDEAYIADIFPQGDAVGNLNVAISFTNLSQKSGDAILDAKLVSVDSSRRELHRSVQYLRLAPGRNETLLVTAVRGKMLHTWSPELPALTLLQLVFRQDLDILDTAETTFGFRTLGYQDGTITLNGIPMKLSVQDSPFFKPLYVLATPEEQTRARGLIAGLKAQGISVLYLAAPPATLLHLTDEEGMLVVEAARPNESDVARSDELRGLILRDRAHPSIVAWDDRGMDDDTASLLHRVDPTRFLIVGPASSPHLWLPDQNAPLAMPLPTGLIPTP